MGDRASTSLYAAAALAFVATLALRAPREGDAPRAYQSALLAVTFALAIPTLARLALLLGSDGLDSSGTLAWAGGALAALGFGLGAARDSALCILLGAVSLVLAVLGFVDLVFSPGGMQPFRWLLLALVAALAAATVASRDHHPRARRRLRRRRRADRAGAGADLRPGSAPRARRRSSVPARAPAGSCSSTPAASGCAPSRPSTGRRARAGSASRSSLATTVMAAGGEATLIGWPLVLAVGAGGLLAIGLRPSRPLPPAPTRGEAAHVFEIRSER